MGQAGYSYRVAIIPKKDGSGRLLEIPSNSLKIQQRKILEKTLYKLGVHRACHGFSKNKSPVTNAAVHRNSRVIIKLDIKDFFRNTKDKYVRGSLSRRKKYLKINDRDIENLVNMTTRAGHLPTGSPTSPALGNIVMYEVDKIIHRWCRTKNLRYTRYADDITISSKHKIPKSEIKEIISLVKKTLRDKRGLKLNRSKIRVFSTKNRMEVTGIVVNGKSLGISKKERNNIRAAIHQIKDEKDIQKVEGRIAWVAQVQPKHAKKLLFLLSQKKLKMQKQ